jgi:hypothetical protein
MMAGLAAALAACAGGEEPAPGGPQGSGADGDAATGAMEDLATSVIARVGNGSVDFAINVTNAGGLPVRLDFNSGQRFDVSVTDSAGNSVWTWSAARSFIQSLGSETIEPGATLVYDASWPDPPPGTYLASAEITASNADIRQSVEVQVLEAGGG